MAKTPKKPGGANRPRRPARADAPSTATPAAEPVKSNGTALAVPGSAGPNTHINLEFGIENLVAIGVVHAENRLNPQLEQQVGEIQRLGNEVNTRVGELHEVFAKVAIDQSLETKCKALIAAADDLGIRLRVDLNKTNFSPESLKYNVDVKFHGELKTVKVYEIDDDHAEELKAEIALLREKQAVENKAAQKTKSRLGPGWLEKQLRASIAENAMNETPTGTDTVKALLASIDRAIDDTPMPAQRQLTKS